MSGWALPGAALVLWLGSVGYPGLAMLGVVWSRPGHAAEVRDAHVLMATSTAWALMIAVGAVLVGWAPGRLLGTALRRRGFAPLAALMLAPICVPAYVVFYAWWQSWPADSGLHEWAVATGRLPAIKGLTLLLGFVCWSWPIVAWCVAGAAGAAPAERLDLLRLEGAGPIRRLADRLRCDGRGLLLGGLIVFLFVFNHTTSFDIAQIFTFGYELKALAALDAGPRAIVIAAAPAVAVAVAGAILVWRMLGRRADRAAGRPPAVSRSAAATTAIVLAVSVVIPMLLFARDLGPGADVGVFINLYGRDLLNTVVLAAAVGGLAAVVAVGLAAAWADHRRPVRRAADVVAVTWLVAGVVPGTLVGVAAEAAYNRPGLDGLVYSSPLVLVLGDLARFGFVGALLGRWVTLAEPSALRDLRRLDDARSLTGFVRTTWPRILAAGGAAFAVTGALSMSELAVTAMLGPAGYGVIARAVLNAVHYQRPDTVLLATLAMIVVGLGAGAVAVAAWSPLRRVSRGVMAAALCLAAVAAVGCAREDAGVGRPLPVERVFGSPGRSLGQFNYPRGIAVDRTRQLIYVVDKTARVQRYGFDGEPQHQWRMPAREMGKPTGLGVAPDGRVYVADTHYHRVIGYDGEGREFVRFGRYGRGPGEFIYPTDVAFGPESRIYVSEYGGNDRINVFTAGGEFLFSFGSMGSTPGEFSRPQAMAFNAGMTELFIADACNHRIVVVTPDGGFLRALGGPGRGPGELAYPYDVMVLADGSLLVCEFGNNRVQRFTPDGRSLGVLGRVGAGPGELQYPWGVDGTDDEIFVLDSGNNRVQVIRNW